MAQKCFRVKMKKKQLKVYYKKEIVTKKSVVKTKKNHTPLQ